VAILGSCIQDDGNELSEIERKLILFTYRSNEKPNGIKFVKIKSFMTLICTALAYGCETWKLSEEDLNSFERKILRCIFGIF